jgi:hypothetical protein
MMAVVAAEFATPAAISNFLGGFFFISHLQVQSKIVLQLPIGFTVLATFSYFSA